MIPLMKNTFLNEFETKKALSDFILKTSKLSMDIQCSSFESEFSVYQGRKSAVLFNSGASSNLAVLQALKNLGKLKNGDNVGFSALTWSTNVMPIIQLGLNPVPIDCNYKTLNSMSQDVISRLSQIKISALFLTNALGLAGDLENIKNICADNNIILLEDNCEALGTELLNGKAGNFGIASTFSFFVAHHMSTIEGGMVCTDDEELRKMLKIVRANGWDRNLSANEQFLLRKKHAINSEFEAKYTFYDLAFNLRPTEITGFLGRMQLKYLDENINKRVSNYKKLKQIVINNHELINLEDSHIKKISSFAFPIVCKTPEIRKKYFTQFSGAGIEIRPMIAGNILKQPFYKKYVNEEYDLPGADYLHNNGFYCGNYPDLSEVDLETITNCLRNY